MGSSKPSLHSHDKEGFLRAFTDEWADVQAMHRCVLEFTIEPSNRRGVVKFTIVALSPSDRFQGLTGARYQCEYPTAQVESVEACLFRCIVQLERILRDRLVHPSGRA